MEKPSAVGDERYGQVITLNNPQDMSMLLHPNPVCLLTVCSQQPTKKGGKEDLIAQQAPPSMMRNNVMTISWLTCIDNQGHFFCAVNRRRYTASLLRAGGSFVLNVPVRGMESLVLAIGGCSGKEKDKFSTLEIPLCKPGWTELEPVVTQDEHQQLVAIRSCVAHLVCQIESLQDKAGHLLAQCRIQSGWVRSCYWDGKTFIARSPDVPPYFTFLGAQTFGYTVKAAPSPPH